MPARGLARRAREYVREVRHFISAKKLVTYDPTISELRRMRSSWIREFKYNNETKVLTMLTKIGKEYSWDNVPPEVAAQALRGEATCTTGDPTGRRRWWEGKYPSFGAFYNHVLKDYTARSIEIPRELVEEEGG